MAVLEIVYEGDDYLLDLDDMDLNDGRAMERFGVKHLRALEEGISAGEVDALTVAYWQMLKQSGQPGARLDHVVFKPVKFIKALVEASAKAELEAAKKAKAEESEAGKAERG
jgi:hypothetical protein